MRSVLRWGYATQGRKSCYTPTWRWFGRKLFSIKTWIGVQWRVAMSTFWTEANISYQPHGINQVIVGLVGQTEDVGTIPMRNKNGGYLPMGMRAIIITTTTMAMTRVPCLYRLVEEVVAITTVAIHIIQELTLRNHVRQRIRGIRMSLVLIPRKRSKYTTPQTILPSCTMDMAEARMGETTHLHQHFELMKMKMPSFKDKCVKPQYKVRGSTSRSLKMIPDPWKGSTMTCIMSSRAGHTLQRLDQVEDMIVTQMMINSTWARCNVV